MDHEARSINLMNAEHVALLAYMQRYVQSITKGEKKPGEVIPVRVTSPQDGPEKRI